MADKNPLTPEEVTELFSEIDASGVLDPTLAKKRTERMREKEAASKRGDKAALAQLRSEDRASQAKHIDPLSEDDPSGSQVSHTITRTAMAVVIGILVLIVGMQIGYGVMRRLNTANLSESVSVDTVSTALKGGLEWGNGFTQFPLDFTVDESCGKCPPCRIGTRRMLEILERITEGKGEDGDIEKLETLAKNIKASALCGLGQTAPNPVLSTLRYFRDEYEAHIYEKRCPAGHCRKLLRYTIDPEVCKGCSLCSKVCPVGAISGEVRKPFVIDSSKCIKCGACMEKCRFNAISRK